MQILTIKFSTSAKHYDYLLRNPDKLPLDLGKSIRMQKGMSSWGPITSTIRGVQIRESKTLPSHVTAALRVTGGNYVVKEDARVHKETPKVSPAPAVQKSIVIDGKELDVPASMPRRDRALYKAFLEHYLEERDCISQLSDPIEIRVRTELNDRRLVHMQELKEGRYEYVTI